MRRTTFLGLTAVTVLYVLTAWAVGAGIVDDSFIFLRYARNIWEGAGPVFNDGERVEGYTSPLWLAVLTLLWKIPVDPPVLAVAASAFCGYAVLVLLALRRPRNHERLSMLGAFFLASNPSFVFWAWSGMDSALFSLLIVSSVLLYERDLNLDRPPVRTGLALALAGFARLEVLWLFPLMAGILVVKNPPDRRVPRLLALCLPFLIVVGAHTLWRHSYYGAWLPNTFAAKIGVPKGLLVVKGLAYVATAAVTYAPLLLGLGFAFRRLSRAERQDLLIPLSLAAWIVLYAVLVGGDHFALFRFLVPALALLAIVVDRLARPFVPPPVQRQSIVAVIGVLLGTNAFVLAGPQTAAARSEVSQARAWAKTGRWCAATLPAGTMASMVVGAIPFYCDRHTYDLLGLVDEHVARHGKVFAEAPAGHQKYDTDYILGKEPDYIFFLSSGMPTTPIFRTVDERVRWLDEKGFALEDLVTDERTLEDYAYRAERLVDGTWIELLERRH